MKVLKIGAVWCPGCLVMRPRWSEIEKEYPWLETIYYDYDEAEEEVKKWNVGSTLPVFIFLDKNDNEIVRLIGEQSKKKLEEVILENKDK
ncbi:MAG: thioredoxin family protein [Mollicutes bacterium]|nr:thioredoxin family protein [Mollicutes bacterium]